jgi:anti-anti-sigma regulatory factor
MRAVAQQEQGEPVGGLAEHVIGCFRAAEVEGLQEALAAEMKENEALQAVVEDFKKVIRLDSSFTFFDRLKFLITGKL